MAQEQAKSAPEKETTDEKDKAEGPLEAMMRGSSGDEQDRSLSVGTYVAPKLFVEYDYSLGDEPDKVKLRYDLNNWVELQTETGENQGADVFFKFER